MALTYVKSSGIDVTGNYTVNNLTATANVTSGYFIGNGSALTSVVATSATTAETVTGNAQANITSVGTLTSLAVTGNITSGNVTGANLISANYFTGTLTTAAQPNITSVGTLTGLAVSGIISLNNSTEIKAAPTISTNTLTIDLDTASIFEVDLNSNITTLTLSNVQASGTSSSFVLIFIADGTSRTVVWPASFKWPSGTAPTITSTNGKKDVFIFFTVDGGTSWQSFISGQNL